MSEFDFCSCDSYAYQYREERRTARKEHLCGECGSKIAPGTRYWYATGRCEGDWFDARVCPRCEALYNWVKAHVPCLCVSFGNMTEELLACAEEAGHQAPGLYFGALRRKVLIDRGHSLKARPNGR